MKKIIQIAFIILSFQSHSQEIEMLGTYVYYEQEDSIAHYSFEHIKMIYDSNYNLVYQEMKRDLGNVDDNLFFEDFRNSPELTIKGFISKTDTLEYIYTENCITGKKYIIDDGDTTNIYEIECVNDEVVKVKCIKGYLTTDTLYPPDQLHLQSPRK
jgi:hypothetical protein